MNFTRLMIGLAVSLFSLNVTEAQNWPRFRGENGAGVSQIQTIPSEWTERNIHWRFPLGGEGNSSPVIWENQVYVTAANAESGTRFVYALDAQTGDLNWKSTSSFTKHKRHKNNSYATSTPAVDELHLYTLWHSPEGCPVTAFTHAGEKVWEFELGPWTQGQGGASSPIVYGEWVFISNDHADGSFLIALDRKTGQEIWRVPRKGQRACFTTPCVYAPEGRSPEIIFTHCYEGIIGVDPATGVQNWHIDVFGTSSQRAVGSPVIHQDLVIGSSGAVGGARNVVAVRPLSQPQNAGDENITAEEAYRLFKSSPHVPTPIIHEGRIYLWEDKGVVSAYHAENGELVWRQRAGGTYFASPIIIDGRILNIDVTGKVFVISLGEESKIVAENQLPEGGKASMSVGAGQLFVRTDAALYAIGN